jgi:hypothetical protein
MGKSQIRISALGLGFRILVVISNSKSGFTGDELLLSSHLTSIVRASQLELSHN